MNKNFKELQGVITNPYIGFTSFQHFRGEALYSDCITGRSSGVASCETENYECYPIPEGVEEKGRDEGFHPDTTVAYIRILWKEFEPKQGEYNYDFIQSILDQAKAKGQTVMFRLMPHSTCERDDVPDWLKAIIPCPARPAGKRVKDSPTDPLYLELFSKAIEKLGERFDRNETLDCVDVALGGSWGEGSQEFPQKAMEDMMDVYVRVFPNTKLIGQFSNVHLLNYIGEKRLIGWRADGTGSPKHMNEIFPARFPLLKKEFWKTAPVSFESYWWISEWFRQGWDIDDIIDKTLEWHISTFNTKSFPIQYELKDKIERWLIKMGYRFVVDEVACKDVFTAGEKAEISMKIRNVGVAPIYNELPFMLRLKGKNGEVVFTTEVDARKWLPGETEEKIAVEIPADLKTGTYTLAFALSGGKDKTVRFAVDTEFDGVWHTVSEVQVR